MAGNTEFDLLNSPLESTNLIEASAGTGKTYTLTGLLLRLILEKDIPINEVLVVTYTEAATSELKDKIRRRLREAAEAFSGVRIKDAFLLQILEKYPDRAAALRKLNLAVNDFDRAAISTIHGFCRRTLIDHAFASGVLFDTELITNEELFVREIIQDFWRNHFYGASHLFYNYARTENRLSLDSLKKLAKMAAGKPCIKVIPNRRIPDCSGPEAEFRTQFEKTREAWTKAKEFVADVLMNDGGLNKKKYNPAGIPLWIRDMDGYLSGECLSSDPCGCFEKFTAKSVQSGTNKGKQSPSHPFFDLCGEFQQARERLHDVYNEKILGLKVELLDYIRHELKARKRKKNIVYFDDLLVKLEQALAGPNGDHLAEMVRDKFKAALIDEFQDTDPVQYAIFEKIFANPGSILFLIGDPKQAIYGFRGADIFTYMNASRKTGSRFTLTGNWRSEPSLISAVNALFSNSANPFVYEDIPFHAAKPPEGKKHELLTMADKPAPPLKIWFLRSEGKQINKGEAVKSLAKSVAAEISRLIAMGREGTVLIGGRPLREGDIAVLVRKNYEAGLIQELLADLGIHAVLFKMGDLFRTHEAMETVRVLAAVANPKDDRLLRAALATDMAGLGGEELDRLMLDDTGWDTWLAKFGEYHDLWAQHGFFRMFRTLLSKEAVLPRLMSMAAGERRCTNILHLSEVLHRAAVEENLSMPGLVKWLRAQMDEGIPELEENQLRLESDENAVKLVTIHKSKGLEYPVVFCPFAWVGSRVEKPPFSFHDESANGMPLTIDLGSAEQPRNKALAEKELLAENLRLLYVALTRAQHMCYLAWGRIREAETSAPAYLFHHEDTGTQDSALLDALAAGFGKRDDESLWKDLEKLQGKAPGCIGLCDMPGEAGRVGGRLEGGPLELKSRSFNGSINRNWRISSFSSLVFNQAHRAELADRDETVAPETAAEAGREPGQGETSMDMFTFPRGPAAGILLHEIFEGLDFTSEDQAGISVLVSRKLREHSFAPSWVEPVCGMIRNVVATPLGSAFGHFSLSEIPNAKRLNELEFHFPLQNVDRRRLKEILTREAGGTGVASNLERLSFQAVEGFMKGFIDMVFEARGRFYILDWKSNFLGPAVEHYNQGGLRKSILDNLYNLQYTLYTVALHRYLKTRIPDYSYESHFGEVFYLFIRGVDPSRGPRYGVYKDRPPQRSVEDLCSCLIGEKEK